MEEVEPEKEMQIYIFQKGNQWYPYENMSKKKKKTFSNVLKSINRHKNHKVLLSQLFKSIIIKKFITVTVLSPLLATAFYLQ